MILPSNPGPIGVFDSGYGGLTILVSLLNLLLKTLQFCFLLLLGSSIHCACALLVLVCSTW